LSVSTNGRRNKDAEEDIESAEYSNREPTPLSKFIPEKLVNNYL